MKAVYQGGEKRAEQVAELVKAVKEYAFDHYSTGGWDILVECYEDAEIAEAIGSAYTVEGAIKKVGKIVGFQNDYRGEIESTAF